MAAEAGGGEVSEAGAGRAGDHCNISGDREDEAELGKPPRRWRGALRGRIDMT